MKKFNFLGVGGATNIKLGGNSCYYKEKDNLIIIDTCESATEKLLNNNAFNKVNNIYIIITHTHYDHVAGLGVLIWYSNFYLNIKPKLVYSDFKYQRHLKKLLKLNGVDLKYIEFIKDTSCNVNNLKFKMLPTNHTKKLQCHGIMFDDGIDKIYYSGDTKDIDFIKKLVEDNSIKIIYTEVATESYDVHIKYDDIKDLNKEKLVLMHFDTCELYKRAKKDGFKVATIK